jgi:MFS family permease
VNHELVIDVARHDGSRVDVDGRSSWLALICVTFSNAVVLGSTVYAFPIFLKPLGSSFHLSQLQIGIAIAAFWLSAPLTLLIPKWTRVFPLRLLLVSAPLLSAMGMIAMAVLTDYPELVGIRLIMGIAKLIGFSSAYILIADFFHKRFVAASAVGAMGGHLGGIVFPVVLEITIRNFGWRTAALLNGAVLLGTIPFIFVSVPGKVWARSEVSDGPQSKLSLRTVDSYFWMLCLAASSFYALGIVALNYLPSLALETGATTEMSAFLLTVVAASAMVGVALIGIIVDLIPIAKREWLIPLFLGMQGLVFLGLSFSASTGHYGILVASFLFGFLFGGGELGFIANLKRLVHARPYPQLFARNYFLSLIVAGLLPIGAGYYLNQGRSHFLLYVAIGLCCLAGAIATLLGTFRWRDQLALR